jgi:hypothetical protein
MTQKEEVHNMQALLFHTFFERKHHTGDNTQVTALHCLQQPAAAAAGAALIACQQQ